MSCVDDLCTTYTKTYEEDQTPCKKRKVAEEENKDCKITSNSDSDIKAALDLLLKYQKETLEKVNENNQILKSNTNTPALKVDNKIKAKKVCSEQTFHGKEEDEFLANIILIEKAKSIEDVLKNKLVKDHFKC